MKKRKKEKKTLSEKLHTKLYRATGDRHWLQRVESCDHSHNGPYIYKAHLYIYCRRNNTFNFYRMSSGSLWDGVHVQL